MDALEISVESICQSQGIASLDQKKLKIINNCVISLCSDILKQIKRFVENSRRKRVKVSDFNETLQYMGYEMLYGYFSYEKSYISIPNTNILVAPDKKNKIDEILLRKIGNAPKEELFHFHWLSINGIQPLSSDNVLYV